MPYMPPQDLRSLIRPPPTAFNTSAPPSSGLCIPSSPVLLTPSVYPQSLSFLPNTVPLPTPRVHLPHCRPQQPSRPRHAVAMSDNFYSNYPHGPHDSLLFTTDNDSFLDHNDSSNEATWNGGGTLLGSLWDDSTALSPTELGGAPSGLDEMPYYYSPGSPVAMPPPMLSSTIPSINIDTSVATPYMNSLAPSSSMTSTPLTPGFISPSHPGYMSSPNFADLTPPTPANPLAANDPFYPSTPGSPYDAEWQKDAPRHTDASSRRWSQPDALMSSGPSSARARAVSINDLPPLSAHPRGPMVPQKRYKPHTSSDRRRYVDEVHLEPSIHFFMQKPEEQGISLADAMHNRFARLVGRDEPMFIDRGPSISVRLNWPGYQPWSRQIPTRDFRNPPGPITRGKLAKNVAKSVMRFITHKNRPMEEDGDSAWKVGGPGNIELYDLVLVRLDHVSKGSWQAQLQLVRAR
ncbi:hypothetical protein BV25DRAFT_818109 [Artomyces pyxidatus]|uniref:Uncharacterized protein n=1 Tax=Artomyces pyxidatus TaxID=48021 RepID=A0ACB8SXQ6_9AGAM|nr:hypothetical protein BV25DRAFT_818109 [Artomyces pyxidatus]